MSDETVEHTSTEKQIFGVNEQIVERKAKKGISWTCKCFTEFSKQSDAEESVYLGWKFEWSSKEIVGYHGEIVVTCDLGDDIRLPFPVKVTKSGEWVERRLARYSECSVDGYRIFQYSFKLTPIRKLVEKRTVRPTMWGQIKKKEKEKIPEKPGFGGLYKSCSKQSSSAESVKSSDEAPPLPPSDGFGSGFMTKATEEERKSRQRKNVDENGNSMSSTMNDTVLLVEGKKVHVNKTFLSIHSEFFRQLFADNENHEIPVEDVDFADFERLLGVVSPNPIFPDDESVEMLLELAERFEMPAVTRHVENFLIFASKIGKCEDAKSAEKLLKLADLFNLPSIQLLVEQRLVKNGKLCEAIVIAQNYGLDAVLKALISGISDKEHMKAIRESEKYQELRDGTKLAIYEQFNRDI